MIKVFIQNESESNQKHLHNEKRLEQQRTVTVSRPYPYPYGFILDTTSDDGDNLDCFVITKQPLKTGMSVECDPVALLEQVEDGQEDHNILTVLSGKNQEISQDVISTIRDFIAHVFDHVPGKQISTGRLLPQEAAEVYIATCLDT
jgi:inorganic pyrophosphatase